MTASLIPDVFAAPAGIPPYEVIGRLGAPVVVALGGISAGRHVCANAVDARPGWWEGIAGPGRAIDSSRYQIVSFDYLDGGRGPDGRPERIVTTHDQAAALAAILDEIGVERVHAIVGASYGGMVGLAFAERYPRRVDSLIVVSAPHRPHPMSTALRTVQRRVVELGLDKGCPSDALSLARALAMTTYRGVAEFADRFDAQPTRRTTNDAIFPVEEYLFHHGQRFAATWKPERFLALSLSGDLHDVSPERIFTPTVLVAAEGDAIVPRAQLEELEKRLAGPSQLVDLPTTTGHDAFLTEPAALGRIISSALAGRVAETGVRLELEAAPRAVVAGARHADRAPVQFGHCLCRPDSGPDHHEHGEAAALFLSPATSLLS